MTWRASDGTTSGKMKRGTERALWGGGVIAEESQLNDKRPVSPITMAADQKPELHRGKWEVLDTVGVTAKVRITQSDGERHAIWAEQFSSAVIHERVLPEAEREGDARKGRGGKEEEAAGRPLRRPASR